MCPMDYLEMILGIFERGEVSISEKINSIRTDKFLYHRVSDGNWAQLELPDASLIEAEKFLPIVPTEAREKAKK
jgi:hypothetical protein